jgi:hypothetical protein
MANLEFGQDRLAKAHTLQAFELAQGSVEFTTQVRIAAKEAIEYPYNSASHLPHLGPATTQFAGLTSAPIRGPLAFRPRKGRSAVSSLVAVRIKSGRWSRDSLVRFYSHLRNCLDFGPFGSARPIQQMPSR